MSATAIDALMRHAIDYAGMFAPAALPLPEALAEYTRARTSAHGWIIGTFVMPAHALGEIRDRDIPLSIVFRDTSAAAVGEAFRSAGRLRIATLEFSPMPAADISTIAAAVPAGVRVYFEVPPGAEMDRMLDAVAAVGAWAKLRTGGLTAEAFPAATAIYHFFQSCLVRHVVCKATAGLHHAVAGRYPLTYEHGCPTAPMFGFLTVSAAAALVYIGAPKEDVVAVLTESQEDAIKIDAEGLRWREYRILTKDLEAMRRTLFASFGSCSAQEPIDDLVRMRLL